MKQPVREIILEHFKRKQEDTKPHAGIYYIVLRRDGNEEVLVKYQETLDDTVLHTDLWKKIVNNLLKEEYGLTEDDASKLVGLVQGMPRGRVSRPEWHQTGEHAGKWIVYHGGNSETLPGRHGEILREFNLTVLYQAGKVAFVTLGHEKVDPGEQADVKRILGV